MSRRLAALAGGLLGVAGLAVSTLAMAPAQAAAPQPWEVVSSAAGSASFTRLGPVPGRVGNAHTGVVSFDTSDDPIVVNLKDWSCPAGATPPRYGIDYDDDTACQRLGWQTSDLRGDLTPEQFWPTFTGPLSATYVNRMETYSWPDGTRLTDIDVSLRWSRTGPLSRTRTDYSDENVQSYDVELTAPMRLTGTVAGIDLGSSRTQTTVLSHSRVWSYSRRLG